MNPDIDPWTRELFKANGQEADDAFCPCCVTDEVRMFDWMEKNNLNEMQIFSALKLSFRMRSWNVFKLSLYILGTKITSNLVFNKNVFSKAKDAAKCLGFIQHINMRTHL